MGFESLVTTGACTKGNLPERNQYDIHCPMMGGPAYKPNYVAASCIARQVAGSCSATTCGRKKIQLHKKPAAAKPEPHIYIEGHMYNNKKVAECAECGRQMPIYGRGCCAGCVARLKKIGILDEKYPAKRSGRRKPATNIKQETTEGSPSSRPASPVFAEEKPDTKTRSPRRCEPAIDACREDERGTSPCLDVTAGETAQIKEADVASKKQTGVCRECKREKPYVARGLCGKCYSANKKAGTLDAKYPAKGLQVDPEQEAFTSVPEKAAAVTTISANTAVSLEFSHRDKDLLSYLEDWAKEQRRSVEDQILYILENMVFERNQEIGHLVMPGDAVVNANGSPA